MLWPLEYHTLIRFCLIITTRFVIFSSCQQGYGSPVESNNEEPPNRPQLAFDASLTELRAHYLAILQAAALTPTDEDSGIEDGEVLHNKTHNWDIVVISSDKEHDPEQAPSQADIAETAKVLLWMDHVDPEVLVIISSDNGTGPVTGPSEVTAEEVKNWFRLRTMHGANGGSGRGRFRTWKPEPRWSDNSWNWQWTMHRAKGGFGLGRFRTRNPEARWNDNSWLGPWTMHGANGGSGRGIFGTRNPQPRWSDNSWLGWAWLS